MPTMSTSGCVLCLQVGDVTSAKTLIALGADVNKENTFKMTALDVVEYTLRGNPAQTTLAQIIKDVGGVSGRDIPPQQRPAGTQRMDTGEEQTMSRAGG